MTSPEKTSSIASDASIRSIGSQSQVGSDDASVAGSYAEQLDKTKLPSKLENMEWFKEPNTFVQFIVGKDETTFTIHREIACRFPVFQKAFEDQVDSKEPQTYRIGDTTEAVFRIMMQFMYNSGLRLKQTDYCFQKWAKNNDLSIKVALEENTNLIELWILAEKLAFEEMALEAATELHHIIRRNGPFAAEVLMSKDLFTRLYERIAKPSEAYFMLVLIIGQTVLFEDLNAVQAELPRSFLLDVTRSAIEERDRINLRAEIWSKRRSGSPQSSLFDRRARKASRSTSTSFS